jgi:hypothetical protein
VKVIFLGIDGVINWGGRRAGGAVLGMLDFGEMLESPTMSSFVRKIDARDLLLGLENRTRRKL